LIHGFVHSDPHPGNVFITEDNKLALLDLGMTAHVDPTNRTMLLKLLLAIVEGRGEEAAQLGLEINTPLDEYNHERVMRQISALVAQTRQPVGVYRKTGRVILELARISTENNIRPAPELVLLGRTFLYLDPILETLSPGFDPIPIFEKYIFLILKRQSRQRIKSGRVLATSLEIQDLLAQLPRRANRIIDHLANNKFEIKVDALDEKRFLQGLEKMSNRITVGLVLSSLIVGAALLMNIETNWMLFGYPVLALVLFLGAAFLGLYLVIGILFNKEE
ncbi:MAG: AarF/ABC1/UbiB kinase family protein, partial [Gammaproteobacteria bacterium]|nr:AarF/ABC1/UbiB kinase family protein [Gammaproteobacteria bacterium]